MVATFTVPLSKVMKELGLTTVYLPMSADEILLSSRDVNRPGLELSGFYDYFDKNRILIFGNAETAFLASFSREKRRKVLEGLFSRKPPAVIVARNITPAPEMVEAAQKCQVALLYGEGILLVGDSGVGKSETAIELIKRGHRLIADDAVEIRRVSAKTLVGSAPENIHHFIELRGIGIINARRIFGMGAVKISERIDMCINLEIWDNTKMYDRMGLDNEYTEILGNKVPVMTIPVKPGRNLAIIIEVAAMNNRQKKMGYNAAQELMASLGMDVSAIAETETKKELDI